MGIFSRYTVLDPTTGLAANLAAGQVFAEADTTRSTPLAVRLLPSGDTTTTLTTDRLGRLPLFEADGHLKLWWVSGGYEELIYSVESILERSELAVTTAQTALAELREVVAAHASQDFPTGGLPGQVLGLDSNGAKVWLNQSGGGGAGFTQYSQVTALPGYPSDGRFPPTAHNHGVGALSDASTLAKSILLASTAAEIRGLIGAGTGNGNSNLQVGPGGAAAYDHAHDASSVRVTAISGLTAQNVQTALAELRTLAGGGGLVAGSVVVRRYNTATNSWPVRGTLPAGVVVLWIGPSFPEVGGLYMQAGIDIFVGTAP